MHSKSPRRRRDEGFRSAAEDDSENRGFRDLKKYYVHVYRYGCPIKDVKKWRTKTRWRGCRLFYLLSYTVYCSGNRLKINITPYGKSSFIQLTELKFKIWRVKFLSFLTTEKLWDRLQFSRNNGFMTCICIWDEEIHVSENWIFSDYQVLFLLQNDPQIENYLQFYWVWLNVCPAPHHTTLGKIQYRTNGTW